MLKAMLCLLRLRFSTKVVSISVTQYLRLFWKWLKVCIMLQNKRPNKALNHMSYLNYYNFDTLKHLQHGSKYLSINMKRLEIKMGKIIVSAIEVDVLIV